ncbi:MAG: chorismate synthase [Clostridia bacterium]|nr:chorismate synthase [Clostridia bacterium]
MRNTIGKSITLTLYGESHGSSIGAVLDGFAAGIRVDEDFVRHQLSLRRPAGDISTTRVESDPFVIESGVFGGFTTGTPICIRIPNSDTSSIDYEPRAARPGHADFAAFCKYHGFEDYRGGGHFSGRLTAAIVAAGAIVLAALAQKGVYVSTHIAEIAGVKDRAFADYQEDIAILKDMSFPVLDRAQGEKMKEKIRSAKAESDSVGGILESVVLGLPVGVGEPAFDSLESSIAHALFSIPAVKGVEFGNGFALAAMRGSESNDAMYNENGTVKLKSGHMGGIFGGISVGAPITVRTAVKPTPTIAREQQTVSLPSLENTTLAAKGRHDPCIVHRAAVVADSMIALTVADLLVLQNGTDWMKA